MLAKNYGVMLCLPEKQRPCMAQPHSPVLAQGALA